MNPWGAPKGWCAPHGREDDDTVTAVVLCPELGLEARQLLVHETLNLVDRLPLALDLLPRLEDEARERQSLAGGAAPGPLPPIAEEAKGEATEKAAALVGVGRTSVANTKAIQAAAPEVVERMEGAQLPVSGSTMWRERNLLPPLLPPCAAAAPAGAAMPHGS